MPLYICNTKRDALDESAKANIAQAITDIHCSVTGAPACFVHAVFFEEAPFFPLEGNDVYVRGTIRKGRSAEQRTEISQRIREALVSHGNVEPRQAGTLIRETPASWVLEGGEIMPEPGEEAEWFAAQEARREAQGR